MKISGIQRPYIDTTTTARRGAPGAGAAAPAAKVAVSAEAKQLAEVRAPESPDVGRVKRLSLAIASGEFAIDAEQLQTALPRAVMNPVVVEFERVLEAERQLAVGADATARQLAEEKRAVLSACSRRERPKKSRADCARRPWPTCS